MIQSIDVSAMASATWGYITTAAAITASKVSAFAKTALTFILATFNKIPLLSPVSSRIATVSLVGAVTAGVLYGAYKVIKYINNHYQQPLSATTPTTTTTRLHPNNRPSELNL